MKMSIRSLVIAAIVSVTAVCVQAAETASEAVVLKVKGSAVATKPGAAATQIKVGDSFPQGTVIQTAGDGEVELQVHSGITNTIGADSKVDISKLSLTTSGGVVTKQSAVIGLSVGKLSSNLDPAKKGINDYSVSTPKGVAAARGTSYVVTVSPSGESTILVTSGVVIFTSSTTGQVIRVEAGSAIKVTPSGVISESTAAAFAEAAAENQNTTPLIDITLPIITSPAE